MDTKYNYSKLKGRIREYNLSYIEFAKLLGISYQSLKNKFDGIHYFTQKEIAKSIKVLDLKIEEIPYIFFTEKVEKN